MNILKIISLHTDVLPEYITPEKRLVEDLKMDEVDMALLVNSLEDESGKTITDPEAEAWVTVGDIIRCFETKESK